MGLEDIYKEVILDHYRTPRNKREVTGAQHVCSRNNPLCGDDITVYVNEQGGNIAEVAFTGQGCSISQASASMMTEAVKGRTPADADALAAEVRSMLAGEREPDEERFGDLVALQGVAKYPVRVKCAVLAWDVLQEALHGGEASGSAAHGA